ncbi:hypothetical protein BDW59DRAFT_174916 [Aspergillus cavernicola]|uniref:Polyketide synthase n=1 Tax=Aspergillus cavernicola TaxID=176166 RepID=A0ABR4HWD7_9EURO
MSSSIPSLIVCGSQTISPTPETLDQLASYLTQSPDLKAVLEAILALPELWATLKTTEPRLQVLSDSPVIRLRDWLSPPASHPDSESDSDSHSHSRLQVSDTLPNVLLAPLTVIIHIAQYTQYLEGLGLDDAYIHIQEAASGVAAQGTDMVSKFQGLCIGSLSAAALELSPTRTALGQNSAAAVRLAMCIGGYVDAERLEFPMVCCIARWGVDCCREEVEEILSRYPEAYISVELDANSVTITAPDCDMPSLRRELSGEGVRVANVPVNGRYHSEKNHQLLQSLLGLCSSGSGPFWVPWGDKLERCLRSILTEPVGWFSNISKTLNALTPAGSQTPTTLELGLVSCIPPSLSALPNHHIIRGSLSTHHHPYKYPETSLAIIGAACKYPGASGLNQLWTLISTGQVMYNEAPPRRFGSGFRSGPESKETLTGNFLFDADQFDCGLFGISPREAMYMDPQQRIALQVAYQAVESSGYFGFGAGSPNPDVDVGCYVGVGSSDYEHNVNSKTPTAYSFTGTSRAFISGRISHYFKWTGPSITLDTACSSSATAIHQACNGIAMGDCSVALAGGVNIMSSLPADQNIAAAGMTNSTGPCRPFDSDAAGYSRGEGCGFIVLKRLSAALAHGDNILGVIAATATNQSDGSSSITVPILQSQSDLYRRVLLRAAMNATDISYVEAHGTGTQRGDPVEYQSIREVFGGGGRSQTKKQKVHIGSIKANIGHTEAASGVAGVLKVLMMLKHGQRPPQANFASLNPAIPSQESDQMVVATRLQQWNSRFRAACVNNYGAAGNNTAIVICQYPQRAVRSDTTQTLNRYPFLISAQSQASLKRYCVALAQYLEMTSLSLAEVASLVARQQNRTLRHRIVFSANSLPELQLPSLPSKKAKPIVLVFGGQTGSTLHFSKAVYDASYYLRQQVDRCDALIRAMGLPSLFPDIFSQDPIHDVVMLHCCLFSVQYACAAAWLDAGLSVHRVIGHSFGQLTAMCIAGVVTLDDALRLVVGRGNLIKDCWGDEKGYMVSVEIDREGAQALARSDLNDPMEVACYNGPNNHVLVGSERAITNLERRTSLSTRRLKTTHGFHSKLVDPLMAQYFDLTRTVSYNAPVIPIETCSESTAWKEFTAQLVAKHSRKPVYFCDAVRRIERDLGPCVWLEVGSGSGAVMLAKQSLKSKSNSLCGLQLGSSSASPLESVVDATLELWGQGASVQCWMYHPRNLIHSSDLDLPGYQFDKSPHWLSCTALDTDPTKGWSLEGGELISLACLSHPEPHVSMFELNQEDWGFAHILRGREVLGGSLWPLALYMEVVARAAALLTPSLPSASRLVRFTGLEIKTPLGAISVDGLCLRLKQFEMWTWEFSLESDCAQHAMGTVLVDDERTSTGQLGLSKSTHYQCFSSLREAAATVFSAPGSVAYKLIEKVAEYDPAYRGIESISMNDHETVARIHLPPEAEKYIGKTSCNPILLDQLLVIAEIHALSMEDSKRSEVFACSGLSKATILTSFAAAAERGRRWSVYIRQSAKQGREIFYDTFVYDAAEGEERLVLALIGARFIRTSTRALQHIVERANAVPGSPDIAASSFRLQEEGTASVWSLTANLLHELTGCLPEQISAQTVLADMGIDSLAIVELEARIRAVFNVHIPGLVDLESNVETICGRIAAQTSHGLVIENSNSTSSRFTPSGSGSSSFESDSEPHATEIALSTPTMAKISKIVATHLASGEEVLPSSRLHTLGLDSLAILELQSDIHISFGVRVHLMQLDCSTTINDLHALVIRGGAELHIKRG